MDNAKDPRYIKLNNSLNYMDRRNEADTVIILQDLEFAWDRKDILKIEDMWRQGNTMEEITEAAGREGDEVFLLLLYLAREKRIKKRPHFIYGNAVNTVKSENE